MSGARIHASDMPCARIHARETDALVPGATNCGKRKRSRRSDAPVVLGRSIVDPAPWETQGSWVQVRTAVVSGEMVLAGISRGPEGEGGLDVPSGRCATTDVVKAALAVAGRAYGLRPHELVVKGQYENERAEPVVIFELAERCMPDICCWRAGRLYHKAWKPFADGRYFKWVLADRLRRAVPCTDEEVTGGDGREAVPMAAARMAEGEDCRALTPGNVPFEEDVWMPTVSMYLNGVPQKVLADSGARYSVIGWKALEQVMGSRAEALNSTVHFKGPLLRLASGTVVRASRKVTLSLGHGAFRKDHAFVVLDQAADILLGSDFMTATKAELSYKRRQLVVEDEDGTEFTIETDMEMKRRFFMPLSLFSAERTFVLMPGEEKIMTVRAPRTGSGSTRGSGYLRPPVCKDRPGFATAEGLATVDAGGRTCAKIANLTCVPVVVPTGAKIASLTYDEFARAEWRS